MCPPSSDITDKNTLHSDVMINDKQKIQAQIT